MKRLRWWFYWRLWCNGQDLKRWLEDKLPEWFTKARAGRLCTNCKGLGHDYAQWPNQGCPYCYGKGRF
jgi:hypothetical protein